MTARRKPWGQFWDQSADDQRSTSPEQDDPSPMASAVKSLITKVTDPNKKDPTEQVINGASATVRHRYGRNLLADIATQVPRLGADVRLLASGFEAILHGAMINDKKMQMEQIIDFTASLPLEGGPQKELSQQLLSTLWNNLQHPPISKLGPQFQYRTADGSNNNLMYPMLGRAGSSYARTVVPKTLKPGILPDPGVVFDAIFARGVHVKEHPSKVSSMMFYLAAIIIHDVFHTDERDSTKIKTSSYLDLAPLYGSSDEEQARVRTFKDGLLKLDTFAEPRLLGFPPGVAALVVCFNRYHNYVAINLKEINENGRFDEPDQGDVKGLAKLDNDLFQTARLVTCGLYINIILYDYVRTILNLNDTDSTWTLDPRDNFNDYFNQRGVPQGIGNQVSCEFNLLYRWHSTISKRDERWTAKAYQKIFGNVDVLGMTEAQFNQVLMKWARSLDDDPSKWHLDFGKYMRNGRGTFEDQDLVNILTAATDDVAAAFGPRQVPIAMKIVEIMGIKQARSWNVATLNEFRAHFNLKPYTKFSDISSDREVAHSLEVLYKHPDYVELYPGIVAEDAKKPGPGSGLCPGYTISRTILADAVGLVRGDRFYTVDFSPAHLTNWGFNQIQSDPDVASGQVIYNLFMRALPNWYRRNSVYAMFPFVHPSETLRLLDKHKKNGVYSDARPSFIPVPPPIESWEAVRNALHAFKTFRVPWGKNIAMMVEPGHQYMLGIDGADHAMQKKIMRSCLYPRGGHLRRQVRTFYEAITTQLITINSSRLRDQWYQLDACKDVAQPSHTIFAANMWNIPLKAADDTAFGIETPELYLGLGLSFAFTFLDLDAARSFKLCQGAKLAVDQLSLLIKTVLEALHLGKHLHLSKFFELTRGNGMLPDYGPALLTRLMQDYTDPETNEVNYDAVVDMIIPSAAAAVTTQAQAATQMLDVFLSEPYYTNHWDDIRQLARSDDPRDFDLLIGYALEACRLSPATPGLLRKAHRTISLRVEGRTIQLKEDDQVYLDFVTAGRDPAMFENPDEIDPRRDRSLYVHHGSGSHECLGRQIVEVSMAAQLKVFAQLRNLRRAPGVQGQLKKCVLPPNPVSSEPRPTPGSIPAFMKEDWSDWWPFPENLVIHHNGFEADAATADIIDQPTGLPHQNTLITEASELNRSPTPMESPSVLNSTDSPLQSSAPFRSRPYDRPWGTRQASQMRNVDNVNGVNDAHHESAPVDEDRTDGEETMYITETVTEDLSSDSTDTEHDRHLTL